MACSCFATPTVLDEFESSELVVVTKLVSVEKTSKREQEYYYRSLKSVKMVVERVYKGDAKVGDEFFFAQGGGADCIWTFKEPWIGAKFLFYLDKPSKKHPWLEYPPEQLVPLFRASGCGRSADIDDATEDLLYLDNIEKVRGKTRLSGKLFGWYRGTPEHSNVKIKIIGKNKIHFVHTDKNGVFEIYDLPAGEYIVEPEMPVGWKIDQRLSMYGRYDQYEYRMNKPLPTLKKNQVFMVLEPNRHAGFNLWTTNDSGIAGKVVSPEGKPMERVCINLVRTKDFEKRDLSYGSLNCTDKKGNYSLEELSPGEYFVVVNGDGKISGNEPFPPVFYPGVSDHTSAKPVVVKPGEHLSSIDITVPSFYAHVAVMGTLSYSDGKPAVLEYVKFLPDDENKFEYRAAWTDGAGRFSLKIPKGVKGVITGEIRSPFGVYKTCSEIEQLSKASNREYRLVKSNSVSIDSKTNIRDIRLTLPIRNCEEHK